MLVEHDPKIDKAGWGEGPWQDEADTYAWTDPETGLYCCICRNSGGAFCGYVGVGKRHPDWGVNYDDLTPWPDVHGGLTYAASGEGLEGESLWVFGFDCSHSGDLTPAHSATLRHLGISGQSTSDAYRDLAYVKNEVKRLAHRLFEPLTALAACGEE